ncbi:hypothetical protein GCM10023174_25430 [Chelativorans composti]|jgi:hypothetical protein|uniref:Uncharacterized protein n=1 Tax=Chelativorans composti TaxID=768533 RepID=A0ABW5DJU0_9HYPH
MISLSRLLAESRICVGSGMIAAAALLALPGVAGAADGYAFDVNITLSEKATQTLKAANEGITVDVWYYGEPNEAGKSHTEEGLIYYGSQKIEVPGEAGTVHISGKTADPDKLKWIQGEPRVEANIYTSRKSSEFNLIACDLLDGTLKQLQEKPVTVHCSLIEEHRETKVVPEA